MLITGCDLIVGFSMVTIMIRVIIGRHRNSDRTTQRTTDNGTVATADLIPDCRTGSTPEATTDRRIQGGIVRVRIHYHQ